MTRHLDLTGIFNGRRFYPDDYEALNADQKVESVMREELFPVGKPVEREGISFLFHKAADGADCVDCAGQRLTVAAPPCRRIRFAGFCTWGNFEEIFTLVLPGKKRRQVRIGYSDWTYSLDNELRSAMAMEGEQFKRMGEVFMQFPARDGRAFNMYCYTAELDRPLKISEIIFPENEYMHIFAITLED